MMLNSQNKAVNYWKDFEVLRGKIRELGYVGVILEAGTRDLNVCPLQEWMEQDLKFLTFLFLDINSQPFLWFGA